MGPKFTFKKKILGRANARTERSQWAQQLHRGLTRVTPSTTSTEVASVVFDLEAGRPLLPGTPQSLRRREAKIHLQSLPQEVIWVWTDGSVTEGGPPAGNRPLGWLYPVSSPDRQDAGSGVPAVPEARMPRRVLPPLQRGAGHTEPRPAAVPSAHAPPLPDDRQHTLPQGS